MSPLDLLAKVSAPVWAWAAAGLIAIAGVQTWRLHTAETYIAQLEAAAAKGTATRATAYAADSDKTAGKEHTHAGAIQKASDDFTQPAPDRAAALAGELAAARRLCSTGPMTEPPVIARKPTSAPLPAAVSQIDRRPSTDSLQKAFRWSQSSAELLSGETPR